EIESELLQGNPLGDPHVRPLWVYLPPAYKAEPERRFPTIYLIQGMTGQLDMWRNRSAFRPNVPELVDRLFTEEGCPPAIDVFGGLATHAGDALFETCYQQEFAESARALRDDYGGSFERFWEDFRSRPAFTKKTDPILVNTYAMAAAYSANEDGTIDLPFDP